ncbi:double zinc ribbon domain-containing protein [Salinispira pacifica]
MKHARFYCENCRNEVRWDAKVCPHCGRFFSSVRCPSCEFIGESRLFVWGCPNCGYAGGESFITEGARDSGQIESYSLEEVEGSARRKRERNLPAWLYPVAIAVLLSAFALLVIVYLTMG